MNNALTSSNNITQPKNASALLLFQDGTIFFGQGIGAFGTTYGEVCFNTAMTGYQEVMSDPSYNGQIINFTFPHIGNTGANQEDIETIIPYAKGLIIRNDITIDSNYRSTSHFNTWLEHHQLIGISGVDTRFITKYIRENSAQNVAICHKKPGEDFDFTGIRKMLAGIPSQNGLELAAQTSCKESYSWQEPMWGSGLDNKKAHYKVVAVDYGAKLNILRCLTSAGCEVIVVPAETDFEQIMSHNPDGIFLSNGPGDPAATAVFAAPMIRKVIESGIPLFGICLGHQLLALTVGAKTEKMHQGHRGSNHPVKNLINGKVEITTQNHGFMVQKESLPYDAIVTHISLFDNTVEGIKLKDKPVFSVQYHPEASPGPHDSHYLFADFIEHIKHFKSIRQNKLKPEYA